jgi:hypothetical protein
MENLSQEPLILKMATYMWDNYMVRGFTEKEH